MYEAMLYEVCKSRREDALRRSEEARMLEQLRGRVPARRTRLLLAVADSMIAFGEAVKARYQPATA